MADSVTCACCGTQIPVGTGYRSCANCITWALRWRERVLRSLDHEQLGLWDAA